MHLCNFRQTRRKDRLTASYSVAMVYRSTIRSIQQNISWGSNHPLIVLRVAAINIIAQSVLTVYIYLVFERSNPPIVLLGIFSCLVSGINHGGIIHTGESWWQASVHLSRIPGFVGSLPSRCTLLHGDAAVDADFLEPFSRCTCIAGWIVLNGRLDQIVSVVGPYCIMYRRLDHINPIGRSFTLCRRLDPTVTAVGLCCIGAWTIPFRRMEIVSVVGSYCIGGWTMTYRRLGNIAPISSWIMLYRRVDHTASMDESH